MSSYELPQNDVLSGSEIPVELSVAAMTGNEALISQNNESAPRSPISPITGGKGQPFVIDPVAFRALTPAESFVLAGEMVKEHHDQLVEKENASMLAEEREVTEANKREAEVISAEIEAEEVALEAKYGPKESWPDNVKKEANTHRIGWGFAAVAGVGALAGLAGSTDANAGGFFEGTVRDAVGKRIGQEVQIESQRTNQEEQARVNYENQMDQTELSIEQNRLNMEQKFKTQQYQKNQSYQQELSRAKSDAEARNIQVRQDADWNNFVISVQNQRQQFEQNANIQRDRVQVRYQGQIKNRQVSENNQRRTANANATNRVITEGINEIFRRHR